MFWRIRAAVLATLGLALLPATAAEAAAVHNTDIRSFDFTEVDTNPCTGHDIRFAGTVQVVDQFTANGGVLTFSTSTTFRGVSGVDLVTGEPVRWVGSGSANTGQFRVGGKQLIVGTLMLRWVQPGPGNDFVVRAHNLLVLDASGIVRAEIGQFDVACS